MHYTIVTPDELIIPPSHNDISLSFETIRYKNFLSSVAIILQKSLSTLIPIMLSLVRTVQVRAPCLDALTFVLFNKPFRKVNKPQLVNSINGKDCRVEVEFSIGKKNIKLSVA
jgi:hypothetical protein